MNNLKKRIEEEIQEINNCHKEMINKISASFDKKHMKLNEEEKKLKIELDKKIEETKNEFENYLSESNLILNSCERIKKANNIFNKNNDNGNNNKEINEIEVLYYISNINQNNEKSSEFLKKIIKHLDISLNEKDDTLNYKYYYFSGLPTPKNINAFKNQNHPTIYWDLGDLTIKNFEKYNNIQYEIEIKDIGKSYNYLSGRLVTSQPRITITVEKKTFIVYEVKIRAFIDDVFGEWSKVEIFDRH